MFDKIITIVVLTLSVATITYLLPDMLYYTAPIPPNRIHSSSGAIASRLSFYREGEVIWISKKWKCLGVC